MSTPQQQAVETMESATRIGSYGSASITVVSGLSLNEWGVIIGIALGVATFGMNWWYKHQHLKLMKDRAE